MAGVGRSWQGWAFSRKGRRIGEEGWTSEKSSWTREKWSGTGEADGAALLRER